VLDLEDCLIWWKNNDVSAEMCALDWSLSGEDRKWWKWLFAWEEKMWGGGCTVVILSIVFCRMSWLIIGSGIYRLKKGMQCLSTVNGVGTTST